MRCETREQRCPVSLSWGSTASSSPSTRSRAALIILEWILLPCYPTPAPCCSSSVFRTDPKFFHDGRGASSTRPSSAGTLVWTGWIPRLGQLVHVPCHAVAFCGLRRPPAAGGTRRVEPMPPTSNEGLQETLLGLVKSKYGATLREIRKHPSLLDLACVRLHATGTDVMQLEESFCRILDQICRTLEPENMVHAARSLFGLAPMSKFQLLTERRRLAGNALGYEGKNAWDPFRKKREKTLIIQVADGLYLMEIEASDRARRESSMTPLSLPDSPLGDLSHVLELERQGVFAGYVRIGSSRVYRVAEEDFRQHAMSRVFEIEAIRSGVSFFRHWYQWTGHGVEECPVVTSPGHRSLGVLANSGPWVYHYIMFDRPLEAGERAVVRLEQSLYDTKRKFSSSFGSSVRGEGLDWLELRVVLPESSRPSSVYRQVSVDLGESLHPVLELSSAGAVDFSAEPGMAVLEWKPNLLRPGHRYSLKWEHGTGGLYSKS